ncbi:MAG: peptidylprolyl isomerase [Archangium sp.]|nr:peptidylprolyl isomerase [Archangium sp.]
MGWLCVVVATACSPAPVTPFPAASTAVATWDGGVVTAAEVRTAVRLLGPGLREQFDTPEGRIQFIDALVAKRLLAAEARHQKLDQLPEIRAQVAELEERLLIQSLLAEAERSEPPLPEADLRAYFDGHRELFLQAAAVRVARVLVRKGAKPDLSKAKLERLRQRLLKGEELARVAAEGEGGERSEGGVVGWMDDPSTPIGRVALALEKQGQVSALIELDDAWACVVALEVRPARTPAFEEVREQVVSRLHPTGQRRVFDRLVKRLIGEAGVRINPAGLD